MRRLARTTARAGFTLVEAAISVTVFAGILGAFLVSLNSAQDAQSVTEAEAQVQRDALRSIAVLRTDLSRAGYENGFPELFDGDEISATYPEFDHDETLDPDGLPMEQCDLVLRNPADDDRDEWPDLDVNGSVVWDDPVAFLLVPDGEGTFNLVRRTTAGAQRVLARRLTRVLFEDPEDTLFSIPLDCIRVTLDFRVPGARGVAQSASFGLVVELRNGGIWN